MTQSDSTLLAGYRELLERHHRVTNELERALESEHGLCLSEYEVLERLAQPKDEHRMQEVADEVHLSQSALSRLVGRLEEEDLVTRAICEHDRRGIAACITAKGRERFEAAKPTHRRVLAETLGA